MSSGDHPGKWNSESERLGVKVDGLSLRNPFLVASGPPTSNANVIGKAFDEGWAGAVTKTTLLDHRKIRNVSPRYARWRDSGGRMVGWENIELISDRPFADWLDDFRRLKDRYPERVVIASVMEEANRDAWAEVIGRSLEAGVDGIELNLSCPHGLPERRMGSAMGQDPELLAEVCGWAAACRDGRPMWAKLTPNVTDIAAMGKIALDAGCTGVSAINTILSVMRIDLETLRPEPSVEGYSTAGGYSGTAVRPIALRMCMELGLMMTERSGDQAGVLSAMGGVETGEDAAQYLLAGASTVQVCTGVMIHGYDMVQPMCAGLRSFMVRHGFESIEAFRGRALPWLTSHSHLVQLQEDARAQRGKPAIEVARDADWRGDRIVEQSGLLSG